MNGANGTNGADNNWHSEEDSLISIETPLSQDTNLSLSERAESFLPNGLEEGRAVSNSTENTSNESGSTKSNWEFEFDEQDKPWPATFERSISLLAGPTMDTDFIDKVTRSPKVTPNLSKRRVSLLINSLINDI